MSSPQLENGYTRIANELLEALAGIAIPGSNRRCIDVIIRKTYGFAKIWDDISLSQFCDATKLSRRAVVTALQDTEAKNMIVVKRKDDYCTNSYAINKDYSQWVVKNSSPYTELSRKRAIERKEGVVKNSALVKNSVKSSEELGKKVVKNSSHTKEITKETKERIHAQQSSASPPKKNKGEKKEKYNDQTPLSLDEFVTSMRASPQWHIRILGEYANTKRPAFRTKGQWYAFIDRNAKAARSISPYTEDQIAKAFIGIRKDLKGPNNPKGFITKWGLETVAKYLDENVPEK